MTKPVEKLKDFKGGMMPGSEIRQPPPRPKELGVGRRMSPRWSVKGA